MNFDNLYAVIIAGGRGKRFWPLSREARPKQLIALDGNATFLRKTIDRILPLVPAERIYIVTAESHSAPVFELAPDIPRENVIVEPVGKNTAPAVALPAAILREKNRDAFMAVFPADHVIGKEEIFIEDIKRAAEIADSKNLMLTFGARPNKPETGYGYIEIGDQIEGSIFRVASFKEKPNRKKAKFFLDSGKYLWNCGMFVFSAELFLQNVKECLPGLNSSLEKYMDGEKSVVRLKEYYDSVESISIDHGVMEKCSGSLGVMAASFQWNDIGSWSALDDIWESDDSGNRKIGCEIVSIASQSNTCYSKKLVALLGVEDLIIVETEDALLICNKSRSQEIKYLVDEIDRLGYKEYL